MRFFKLKIAGSFLVLPGMLLLALIVSLGPGFWTTIYHWVMGMCQAYNGGASSGKVVLSIISIFGVAAAIAGTLTLLKEFLQLRMLSKTLAASTLITFPFFRGHYAFVVEESRPFAFCHGLLSPRIYISTGLA